jgi:hypothetical protein
MRSTPIALIFEFKIESSAEHRGSYECFIECTRKLVTVLEPFDKFPLQVPVVIQSIEVVGEPEVSSGCSGHRSRMNLTGLLDELSLEHTEMVIPAKNRMPLFKGSFELWIGPVRAKNPLDVLT